MTTILDGKAVALDIRNQVKARTAQLQARGVTPGLAVLLVGDDPASHVYVKNKTKACQEAGIRSFEERLPADLSERALLDKIESLNQDEEVDGILVQLPLPPQISPEKVILAIRPEKDVDGFHPMNVGALASGKTPGFVPCTPAGILRLLDAARVPLAGKRAIILGRSAIVGRPAALLLLGRDATVTIAHSKTEDLPARVREADIVVAALGKPEFVLGGWLKPGAAVIDVGVNRLPDGRLVGDVDFASAKEHAGVITPVPGGVGPMTIALLLENTLRSAERRAAD